MKFVIPDASESEASSHFSDQTDDSDFDIVPKISEPVSDLGRKFRDFVTSSDESVSDEDEDDFAWIGGLPKVTGITGRSSAGSSKLINSQTVWHNGNTLDSRSKGKGKAATTVWEEDVPESVNSMRLFMRVTEEEAMREGRKSASNRRARLAAIHQSARQAISKGEQDKISREDAEMAELLQGLVLQQERKEKELADSFAARERKLWEDIDAAINGAEKREAEARAAEAAQARKQKEADELRAKKQKEDEEAKAIAASKDVQARRAAAEQMAKDKVQKDHADLQAKEERQKADADAKAQSEAKRAVAAQKSQTSSEWKSWVDRQRWMKTEVINPMKADKDRRTALRTSMRFITRSLGQVTNSKETIIRVTASIHEKLVEQLPSPPSSSSPAMLDSSSPLPYAYLLSHLSKGLIKQAESEVSAKAEAAFPLARVVVGLLLRGHAALSDVLFARLVKKCPWVIPFYPSKQPDQSREEYEKSTGRGSDESVPEYIARMGGIAALYFAILQTPLASIIPTLDGSRPTPDQLPILLGTSLRSPAAWSWLANSLRDPMAGMQPTAHLVTAWIEIVGKSAVDVYGRKQLDKVLDVMYRQGIEGEKIKGDGEAARQRLSLVLQEWKSGGLAYPKGRNWE